MVFDVKTARHLSAATSGEAGAMGVKLNCELSVLGAEPAKRAAE